VKVADLADIYRISLWHKTSRGLGMNTTLLLKRRITRLIGSPVALGLVIIATGCAGNRYDRSTGESIDDHATTSRVKSALGSDTAYMPI
jgi:hypothetical protein